jgi:CheY-like chemotaxis protein
MKEIKNIVLIDDNKIDCFVNQKIISIVNKNAVIKMFKSSIEAIEYFNTTPEDSITNPLLATDLVLLDINMPIMNGFEFLNKLNKMKTFLRNPFDVYFLSSSNNKEDITEALNIKFCSGYIDKPLTKEKINDLLVPKNKINKKSKRNINSQIIKI